MIVLIGEEIITWNIQVEETDMKMYRPKNILR